MRRVDKIKAIRYGVAGGQKEYKNGPFRRLVSSAMQNILSQRVERLDAMREEATSVTQHLFWVGATALLVLYTAARSAALYCAGMAVFFTCLRAVLYRGEGFATVLLRAGGDAVESGLVVGALYLLLMALILPVSFREARAHAVVRDAAAPRRTQ